MSDIVFPKKTTVVLRKVTRDKLAALGGKDDTFDIIVEKLLNEKEFSL